MKIFGTIFPFIETEEKHYRLGRYVANYDFFIALLKYGTFDEYHIFCMSTAHFNLTLKTLQKENISASQKRKVKLFLYSTLIKQISSVSYTVFHLGGWGYFFAGLAWLRKKYSRSFFPLTGIIHSLNGIDTIYAAQKLLYSPHYECDAIICTSKQGREVVKKLFATTTVRFSDTRPFAGILPHIPLGIDCDIFNTIDRTTARRELGIPLDASILLSVGRISPQTKYDPYPILQLIKRLVDKYPEKNPFCILAGGASVAQEKIVIEMAKEIGVIHHIIIISNFEPKIKNVLFVAADIYISLSDNIQETFGISVIEAMAYGLPVIVSDIDGYKDLIEDGINGFKIPTVWIDNFELSKLADIMNFETMQLMLAQCCAVNTEKLFTQTVKLLNDDNLKVKMGISARIKIKKYYLWETIVSQYENLWDNLVKKIPSKKVVDNKINPYLPDYEFLFSHYPSFIITANSLCDITDFGLSVVAKKELLPIAYNDISAIINKKLLLELLNKLSESPLPIYSFPKIIDTASINFHLLWMAKYGLITITEKEEESHD